MESNSSTISFGKYLRSIRVNREISLGSVAEETKISLSILRAIENEDFTVLPADVYTMGFIRAYARAIGADDDEAVALFKSARRLERDLVYTGAESRTPPLSTSRRLILALFMLGAIIVLSLVADRLFMREEGDMPPLRKKTETVVEKPGPLPTILESEGSEKILRGSGVDPNKLLDADAEPAPAGNHEAGDGKPTEEKLVLPGEQEITSKIEKDDNEIVDGPGLEKRGVVHKLILTFFAKETTWIRAIIDGSSQREFLLKPGERVEVAGESRFDLVIGNAGGVKIRLDDKDIELPGKSGQVVRLTLP